MNDGATPTPPDARPAWEAGLPEELRIDQALRTANDVWRRAGAQRATRREMAGELRDHLEAVVADGGRVTDVVGDDAGELAAEWARERVGDDVWTWVLRAAAAVPLMVGMLLVARWAFTGTPALHLQTLVMAIGIVTAVLVQQTIHRHRDRLGRRVTGPSTVAAVVGAGLVGGWSTTLEDRTLASVPEPVAVGLLVLGVGLTLADLLRTRRRQRR